MGQMTSIRYALLSVSDKSGIVELAEFLISKNVKLISTGGTSRLLKEKGLEVQDVSDITQFPEMMDGRVKTLHPKIHGGILAIRDKADHQAAMEEHDIPHIDLIVVNLYPFEETIAKTDDFAECIEQIDIGGPAMVRASAKNHGDVTIITDASDYETLKAEIESSGGTTPEFRKKMAAKAFARTAHYDAMISQWFAKQLGDEFPTRVALPLELQSELRYGENPHQQAALYKNNNAPHGVASAKQIQGKELSYNNLADTDAALNCVLEFEDPAVVIVKHANPCGVAVSDSIPTAFDKALACDPVSAYGSIIALNRDIDDAFLDAMGKLFVEVIIAPSITDAAKERLSSRKNLRVLILNPWPKQSTAMKVKSISGGFLLQTEDNVLSDPKDWQQVSERKPTDAEKADMAFAEIICKHVKSNAIVMVKDKATIGIGAGQTNRLDSTRIAAWRAQDTATSVENAKGAVLASDAFFPFADGVEAAAEHGIAAIIQPGGSIRDDEVVAAADKHNIAMVCTGIRHFNH